MFRFFQNSFLSLTLATTSISPSFASAMTGADGQFFFRYKTSLTEPYTPENPDPETKDITAFYAAGVGYEFSERLPMKPQWADDNWRVVGGALPRGLIFDPDTLTFSGTPSEEVAGRVAYLAGYDALGNEVASAVATFDVVTIKGAPVKVDIYNHTGKYKVDEMAIPSNISVFRWNNLKPAPAGVSINGPFIEGTPTTAVRSSILGQGLDYTGGVVVTYIGSYVVEDGPTFPKIADMVTPLPQLEVSSGITVGFGAPSKYKVNREIDPKRAPRYFVELDDGQQYPLGVSSNDDYKNLVISGVITRPYDTARIRFRALDSDQTTGYSNWFTFGSSDPQPGCAPNADASTPVQLYTGMFNRFYVPRPYGGQGEISYHLASGQLPDGIKLSPDGLVSGTPAKVGDDQTFKVRIDVTNGSNTVSTECFYRVEVGSKGVGLVDATPAQSRHIRVGDTYNGKITVAGGISPYSVALTTPSDWPTLSFTTPTTDTPSLGLSGSFGTPGQRSVPLTLSNGDTKATPGAVNFFVHDHLSLGDIAAVHVKRHAAQQTWATLPYDLSTVIPDTANPGKYPAFKVVQNAGGLPQGIALSGDTIYGATAADAKSYGPFRVELSDYSGDTKTSNEFTVIVDPRDPIAANPVVPPLFTAQWDTDQKPQKRVFDVTQPPGAKNLAITWTLNDVSGSGIPDWLAFDTTTGDMTALKGIDRSFIGEIGPFTITATDSEGSSVTSEQFNVTVRDWPTPSGLARAFHGTAQGDKGEQSPKLNVPSLRSAINKDTVIGGVDAVVFLDASPKPAGLEFDPATGILSGYVTEEFNGDVHVRFKDGAGREGSVDLPLEVRGYPKVTMGGDSFELPRLSDAGTASTAIQGKQVSGFWTQPAWAWADGITVPPEFSVDQQGKITGMTSRPVGTVISGLKLKATSTAGTGETLVSETPPFAIKVVNPVPLTLAYSPARATFRLKDLGNGRYSLVSTDNIAPIVGGSAVTPLSYSLDQAQAVSEGLSGIGLDPLQGVLTGSPAGLGLWNVRISVADKEGTTPASGPVDVAIKATLAGNVETKNANASFLLRQGEPFTTQAIAVTNSVGSPKFLTSPAALPETVDFSASTGAFSDDSSWPTGGDAAIIVYVDAKDDDGRTLATPLAYGFTVVRPLSIASMSKTLLTGKQYSPKAGEAIDASFDPDLRYVMGKISWSIDGDLPGTLVNTTYGQDGGPLLGYSWTDEESNFHELSLDGAGKVVGHKIGGAAVASLPSDKAGDYLPPDALVFDSAALTLKGVPSKAGTFAGIRLVASDDHQKEYIKAVPSQRPNNTAYSPEITISVSPADPLVAVNMVGSSASDTEQLYRYTNAPTMRTVLSNAAYGRPVTWTKTAGTLPPNVSASGTDSLVYAGYPEATGSFPGIVYRARDAAGRTVTANAFTFNVAERKSLELSATANPAGLLVNAPATPIVVTALNSPYGRVIPKGSWTVTGVQNLPPGMTPTVTDGKVSFEGTPTVVGKYDNVSVSAVDSLGQSASITLTFTVILPTDAIVLNVSDIKTKVGYPFAMQATSSNTYGAVCYYSNDISGDLATRMAINGTSGLVSGQFSAVGDHQVDVFVTDASNRVTSKPVRIAVLPSLRVTVPQIVATEQSVALTRTIATDYVVGTVTYKKGAGSWPEGIDVDPTTGSIFAFDKSSGTSVNNVIAEAKDYPGLTIEAVDTFGNGLEDRQNSNAFTIHVAPINASPVISAIPGNRMVFGKQGTASTPFTPTVKDSLAGKPWNYAGTVYSINRSLPAGLLFDTKTGTISGTPSEPIIVRDLKIKVTAQNGDSSETPAFWFGVAPKDPIVPTAGQKTSYTARVGSTFTSDKPLFDNVIGNLTYAMVQSVGRGAFDTTTGIFTHPVLLPTDAGTWPITVVVTDEFGRTGTLALTQAVVAQLTISQTSFAFDKNATYTKVLAPTVSGVFGTASFVVTGLPSGITYDTATGAISGRIDAAVSDAATFTVTWTVTDSKDGKTASTTVAGMKIASGKTYWRVLDQSTPAYFDGRFGVYVLGGFDWTVWEGTTASGAAPSRIAGIGIVGSTIPGNVFTSDQVWSTSGPSYDGGHIVADANGAYWRAYRFTEPVAINRLTMHYTNTWTAAVTPFRTPIVQSSTDGITWTYEFSKLTADPNDVYGTTYIVSP
ncbi:putative Ig domain-containing protein [Rhizobium sp. BK176]|uniref:putative Ig domain-containing protein n=1 Tax=Rhizobium sp. BK176 TaxID=2587071 RepID=UPI002166E041|nr:putative Ig domain-containing protein [Rhizobium sp. BK176]MCS4089465.1 hypothetical protein [Rhizobium sp. BK176]